ncbi:hypothetical protein ACOSQ2_023996 [Xanthoceras sorbifolium]
MEGVRLSVHFPKMREVYSSTAENIMSYDLEISKETNAESLREWRDKIDQAPNLLKPLIKDYLPKRKIRVSTYCEKDASRAGLLRMRPFGEAKSISGHQTLQLMRRPYGVKGSVYVVTLPAFQRCLKDGPDAAEQQPGSGFPTGRGTGYGHLEAHHDLQARLARPGKATRLGVRGSIVPAASRTLYSSFLKVGGRDLFSTMEKN